MCQNLNTNQLDLNKRVGEALSGDTVLKCVMRVGEKTAPHPPPHPPAALLLAFNNSELGDAAAMFASFIRAVTFSLNLV